MTEQVSTPDLERASATRVAVSLDEAARLVGCSRGFLDLERHRGRLETHRVGRRRMVLVEDLVLWIRRGAS